MSGAWDGFLSVVQTELSRINVTVQNPMDRPAGPPGDRPEPSPRLRGLTQRAVVPPTSGITNEPPWGRERPSNYQIFPRRQNASVRIFRPQSPDHILRRRERCTVPVILGVLLTPANSIVPIERDASPRHQPHE
jgi:hypothetical protein